jgi:hypothetical protein
VSDGRRRAARALLALGIAGLVLGAVAGAQLRRGMPFGPPLLGPSGLAVGDDGRVYAGTRADRIHVYGPDGRFVRGWALESGAGAVRVRVAGPERIEAATERSGRLHAFDHEGRLVESSVDPGAFARFGATHDRVAEGPGGVRVEIGADGALRRTEPEPPRVLAPPVGRPLAWFAKAPLPVLTLLLTGSVTAILAGIVLANRRRTVSPRAAR